MKTRTNQALWDLRWKIRRYFEALAREYSLDMPKTDIASQALKLATPLAQSKAG